MLGKAFDFGIFYSSLFVGGEIPDMPDVNEDHWKQGFYWLPHHVCFLLSAQDAWIEAMVVDAHPEVEDEALTAIEVPLSVGERISVDTLPDHDGGIPLDVPPGEYSLRFVLLPMGGGEDPQSNCRIHLTFLPMQNAPFAILRTGYGGMTATEVLTTHTGINVEALEQISFYQEASGNSEFRADLVRRGVLPPIEERDD